MCIPCTQVTALGTVIVGSSATLFAWHLVSEHDWLASVHPPLMYCLLLALLLLPADFAYKVRPQLARACNPSCPTWPCALSAQITGEPRMGISSCWLQDSVS